MRKIAMFQPKIVVATGQFETATRQDMPITWSSPMPPGWQRQETQIRVPAGTYLYVPKLAVEPIPVSVPVDFDDFITTGAWMMTSNSAMSESVNAPHTQAGLLEVYQITDFHFQRYTHYEGGGEWTRCWYKWRTNTWTAWRKIQYET